VLALSAVDSTPLSGDYLIVPTPHATTVEAFEAWQEGAPIRAVLRGQAGQDIERTSLRGLVACRIDDGRNLERVEPGVPRLVQYHEAAGWGTASPPPSRVCRLAGRPVAKVRQLRGYEVGTRFARTFACGVCVVVGIGCTESEYCDPSYRGVCIPGGAKYDLNCVDLDEARFIVKGVDAYNLDGDRDEIGCEAY
jgi:hypothetical protein